MKVYQNLAPYYDRFMDHINYEREAESIYRFLFQINKIKGHLLDIGAGSGGHLLPLLSMGIKADALDYSEEMIRILRKKIRERYHNTGLYTADMRSFQTEHRYDVIYCMGETIHHLESAKDVISFLKCCHNALKDNGHVIFSWQEAEYFDELADCGDFYETHGEDYLLWSSRCSEDKTAATISYTAFICGEKPEEYHRIRESHRLAIFENEAIAKAIDEAGFILRNDLEDITFGDILEEDPYKHITVLEKIKK